MHISFNLKLICNVAGWKMERQLETLHCTVLPSHSVETASQFVQDLRNACDTARVSKTLGMLVIHIE